jgi:hypothetical protein
MAFLGMTSKLMIRLTLTLLALDLMGWAAPPPLRDQVSLNGEWEQGGLVPDYGGRIVKGSSAYTYQRQVAVPATWQGKVIKLEFEAVNFSADVYIDDRLIANHLGAWNPFAIDLTSRISPGASFVLRVVVKGSQSAPIAGENGAPLWPIGTYNQDGSCSGIVDNVWLRAYGKVCIEDAFIKTSFRTGMLAVDYTVKNNDTQARTVEIASEVCAAGRNTAEMQLRATSVTLSAGESKKIAVSTPWKNPSLWWPDQPNLYYLTSRIKDKATTWDQEVRRFGFKEMWIESNYYVLNGVRVNLRGENIPTAWCPKKSISPEAWPATVEMLKNQLNFNVFRFHQLPGPGYMIEECDEKGLMIIEESALYGRPEYFKSDLETLHQNCIRWIEPWIKGHRNHPSIVIWSGSNEFCSEAQGTSYAFPILTSAQLQAVGETILAVDPTRPISFDGEGDIGWETANIHYPEGYESLTKGSIYSWAGKVHPNKPTGIGEFLACCWVPGIIPSVYWWQGTWVRGLRDNGFADIRPFVMHWAWDGREQGAISNLANSFAPVALFDKAYDDLGIDPVLKAAYPTVDEGSTIHRRLVLFNDEYRDTNVTISLAVKSGVTTFATGNKTYQVKPGHHRDIPCTFQVPFVGGKSMELVLSTWKNGKQKFTESKFFNVRKLNQPGSSSNQILLEETLPLSEQN